MSALTNNMFLDVLSAESHDLLLSKTTPVMLPSRTFLSKAEEVPAFVFFLTSGVTSVVASTADGGTAEVGLIGREGLVGAFQLLGPALVPTDCFIQMEGAGLRLPLADMRAAFRSNPEIHARTLEFVQQQSLSLLQIAGCHRFHDAEERLARWLLMAQDRSQTDVLDLTQEFLAMMLGARRTTVTMIAGAMQRSGLIEYNRGRVKILSRENLEHAACDCYEVTRKLYDQLYQKKVSEL